MTKEEAVAYFKRHIDLYCVEGICREAEEMAIKAIEQQPCEDAISRQAVLDKLNRLIEVERLQGTDEMGYGRERVSAYECMIHAVESEYLYPTIQPQPKTGHCKDCKYFEYDSVETVYGIPLIIHEICSKWGRGCKTREDGYCFLFESQESEVQDADSN